MYVIDLLGNRTRWKLSGEEIQGSKSDPHLRAREVLKRLFFSAQILEEVSFNPKPRQTLYFDFYLPSFKMAVEVQGKQHTEYVPFFHKNIINYGLAKTRDKDKKKWCQLNNIILVELPEDETNDDWTKRLSQRQDGSGTETTG
jgi:hypothetical protein